MDRVQRQQQLGPNEESSLKMEVQGLQEVVNERDRTIEDLRKQMKYYVAFAENSITGHPDEPVKDEAEQTISHLQDDLEGAKVRMNNGHFCTCTDAFLLFNSGADSQSHLAQLRAEVAARGVVFAHEGGLLVGGERRKQPQHREHSDGNVGGGRRCHFILRFVEWLVEV